LRGRAAPAPPRLRRALKGCRPTARKQQTLSSLIPFLIVVRGAGPHPFKARRRRGNSGAAPRKGGQARAPLAIVWRCLLLSALAAAPPPAPHAPAAGCRGIRAYGPRRPMARKRKLCLGLSRCHRCVGRRPAQARGVRGKAPPQMQMSSRAACHFWGLFALVRPCRGADPRAPAPAAGFKGCGTAARKFSRAASSLQLFGFCKFFCQTLT
jgi:hypothetical protein